MLVLGLVRMRYIEADENLSMRGQLLREAIEDDIRQGLVPFWVSVVIVVVKRILLYEIVFSCAQLF